MGTLTAFYSPLSSGEWLLFAFVIAIAVLIGVAIMTYLTGRREKIRADLRLIPTLLFVSLGIELLAGIYLLLFESTILNLAPIYWGMILVYTAGNIIFLELFLLHNKRGTLLATMVWGFLGVLGILLSAGLNFPFSQLYGYGGINYVFGFGSNGAGTFGVSFALVLMLVFSVMAIFASHSRSLEKQQKRKR